MKEKIKHPYHVPDHFFEDFESELIEKLEVRYVKSRHKSKFLMIMKYAAIIVFSFFLGGESFYLYQQSTSKKNRHDIYSVETILSQVTDEEITNYMIENVNKDIFE